MYNPEKHSRFWRDLRHRRFFRLKGYDYSQAGAYFVTVCVEEKKCILGDIQDGKVLLSPIGEIVYQCWKEIADHFDFVKLDTFVIMPNHLHGVLFFVGARSIVPKKSGFDKLGFNKTGFDKSNPYIVNNPMLLPQITLGKIIRFFKAEATYRIRNKTDCPPFRWQRNYYEHIIRNEDELNRIREYIINNPLQWQFDRENPDKKAGWKPTPAYANLKETIYGKKK